MNCEVRWRRDASDDGNYISSPEFPISIKQHQVKKKITSFSETMILILILLIISVGMVQDLTRFLELLSLTP